MFLKSAGATMLGVSTAGCAGNGSEGDDGTTEATTTTTESTGTTDGANSSTAESGDVEGTVGSESDADLEITEHTFFQEGSTEGVRGTVTNVSDKTFSLVVVHVNPESEDGDTLGRFETDSSESTDTLEPDATWEFEVVFDGDLEFTQYTIWATGQTEGTAENASTTGDSSA
ncbi:hypothetical protein SAMN04487948_103310 [Halogranum amylolyticum]|uniref:Uncharacterized protein n=1 Tax=Halogranum amylolyticum TaxID=660520 RepID=A0A1H8QUZ2_9EURY|nr:FxLYD domain-containing protein [Halogranum amylolyticum]SEO57643.1 hypothetical protein SAMN04487948_103310 [Halogranum amylolyticum]